MKNKGTVVLALLAAMLLALMCGCSAPADSTDGKGQEPVLQETETPEPGESQTMESQNTSQAADASQMTTVEDVVEEGMVPVEADSIQPGVYPISVDCSSSMFKITDCELTVENGNMTALLTMSSDTYAYVYSGTAEEAAAADVSDYIHAVPNAEGNSTFFIPVPALDAGVACAAWSKNKELWYDRTLVFRADSLPSEAFAEGYFTSVESLGLEDGTYMVDVSLAGGSGKASVQSPTALYVSDGEAKAEIIWSSSNYDYMLVNDERYDADIVDGHSFFMIPVSGFDRPLPVVADTTAMSQPHEIEYTLRFDSASLAPAEP